MMVSFFYFFLKLKGHIAISVTLYPKLLPIDLWKKKNVPFPVMVSVWQEWNVAANELFKISHGGGYTIRYALLCEAYLCDIAGGRLGFLQSSSHENEIMVHLQWDDKIITVCHKVYMFCRLMLETLYYCMSVPVASPQGSLSSHASRSHLKTPQ